MASAPQDKFGLVGTTLDRKFRIERLVAEGGFGVLYYGTHLMLDRPIALKVLKIPKEFTEAARATFIDGFAREAKTIVRISHPNIVQVLDFGVSPMPSGEMAPWMALEWLNGPTLRDVLVERRGQGGRPPHDVLALLRPVLEALAYAHEEGIAHRDIKPANMMLVNTKRGSVLKLLDFGIAKAMHEGEEAGTGHTATTSSLNAFSLAYAAPEQIGGSRTGPWTDVHAMALIITEMLTDQPPYDGRERTEICVDALSSRRPTPSKRNLDAGPWEAVLANALSLRPAERFPNAGDFLRALESTLPAAMSRALGSGPVMPGVQPGSGAYPAAQSSSYGAPPGMQNSMQPPQAMQPMQPMLPQYAGPPGMPMPGAGYAPQGGMPYGAPPAGQYPPQGSSTDPAANPTTLRGLTTGANAPPSKGGSGRKMVIVALVVLGLGGTAAAVGIQMRNRAAANAASPGMSVPQNMPTAVSATHGVPAVPANVLVPNVAVPNVPTVNGVAPNVPTVNVAAPNVPVVDAGATAPNGPTPTNATNANTAPNTNVAPNANVAPNSNVATNTNVAPNNTVTQRTGTSNTASANSPPGATTPNANSTHPIDATGHHHGSGRTRTQTGAANRQVEVD